MKKYIGVIAVAVLMMAGNVLAHCGSCGTSDGYVCAKDQIASNKSGNCSTCGGAMAKGDVQEVKSYACPTCGAVKDAPGQCDGACGSTLAETVSYKPA